MDSAIIWFVVGAALILSEFALPGIILVFFGVAAWLVALLDWLGVLEGLPLQLLSFTGLSITLIITLRRFCMRTLTGYSSDASSGESAMDEFLGREVTVLEDFAGAGSHGKVEFKGAAWNAVSAASFEKGETAIIASRDGLKLNITRKGQEP